MIGRCDGAIGASRVPQFAVEPPWCMISIAAFVLIGIGLNRDLEDLQHSYAYNAEFYVKSPAEMCELFADYPGACERTGVRRMRSVMPFSMKNAAVPSTELSM